MIGEGYKKMPSSVSSVPLIRPSVFRQVTDFANVFKAFIGTNWIGLPFAFKQSGIVLGCVGILIIALITDHCCQLIIKCKKAAVQIVLDSAPKSDDIESLDTDMTDMRNTVEKRMFFGEIGRIALGKKGVFLVNAALLTTQYGFCIGYFIFLGNTITSMFPPPHNSSNDTNTTAKSHGNYHPPAFALLILVPLIPLILFSYIRSIRKLGPVSFAANVALLVAFVSVVGYMLSGLKFKLKEIRLSNWATFPVFFGQVTSAYEGIGTLIPIETSMAENRHRFPLYLHFAVGSLSVILGCFGILGYTVYGEEVNQIVTESFPSGVLIQVVRCLLCFAILLTYPLQVFPVIEIIEGWLFKSDNNTAVETSTSSNSESSDVSVGVQASESSWLLAPEIPKQKSLARKWKKNLLRTFIVLTTAGIAIALKDDFAYVSAIVGSIGSATLGFILPCVFHLVLCKDSNTMLIKVKDCLFIAFGIIGGVVGVTITIKQIVQQFTKS